MASDNETSCVGDPNFAVICSFLEKFAKSCGISHPNILELQEMLENSQEVPQPLVDLHVKLLRKARKSVSGERWEKAIIKFCHSYSNQDGWEIERFGYKKARISVKLRILKMLLELQFDLNTKFKTEVNRLSADELRCQPLGRDKMGQTYWCQLDEDCNLRVYREDLDDETWEVVARDRDGLIQLISQLSSNDPFRKDTEAILNEDSNSLEIEKPITDTGQAVDLQEESAAAESPDDDDDDEEFEEIDDEESEDKEDDIPSHRNIEESSAAEKEEECNVEKKDAKVTKEKSEECVLKPFKPTETEEIEMKPAESSEYILEHALKPGDLKEEFVSKPEEPQGENVWEPPKPKDHLLIPPESKECLLKLEESKEQYVLKPKEEEEVQQQQQQQQMLKSAKSKEDNVIKSIEPKDQETLISGECKGVSSLKPTEDDSALKISESKGDELKFSESKENEIKPIESKEECSLTPAESGKNELKHAKFKEEALKIAELTEKPVLKTTDNVNPSKILELTEKPVLKTTDNVNPETAAEKVPEVEGSQNNFSSINKVPEIERHIPRPLKNDPSQNNLSQNEFIGMDLSKPSQPRVLEPPVSKNIGIDLTSKSYTEERSLQPLVKIEDLNESSTSNSSLIAEDLSDSSRRSQSNSGTFDHNRFVPLPLTATDLSTKRPVDLLQPSKVTIMNSMPGFGSLPVNRLILSGKRLHESDLMTNEAKKLRLEQTVAANCHKLMPSVVGPPLSHYDSGSFDSEDSAEVGEAIEEPLMLVRGEGSGADCNTGNPGKEGENGKSKCDSSKSDQISAGEGAGKSEKCAVSSDNGNISTSKEEVSEKGPEISNQETKISAMNTSSASSKSDIISDSIVLREDDLPKDETFVEKEVELNCEKRLTLCVEMQPEDEINSDLNTKRIDVLVQNLEGSGKESASSGLQTLFETKEIPDTKVEEKSPFATNKIPCLNKDSSKEEPFLQSPPKHSPKLWSIETICAPDGKSKDNPKTGSGTTKISGNSFLGVVSDSLYGDKYNAKFQDAESVGRINPGSSSPTKRPSRWDVGGGDKPQKKGQAESNSKGSILQNDSSLAADSTEQKIDKLCTTNTDPVAEEQNVALEVPPAVDVSSPSKNIVESRVQIAGAVAHRRGEGATPEKQAETHGCGSQESQPSGQCAEKDRTGDTNGNLEKLPPQGFFFGPGCLLKSPIKKTTEGINSSLSRDSVKTDLIKSGSSERLTSMSSSLCEQSNRVVGESVSEMIEMKDQGDNCSDISARSPKITACTASSSTKNDSPSKVNTLHSIDTIMSSHKPQETNNFPQPTESCVPFSAEVSSLESGSCAPEKSGGHKNQLEVKEANSGSQLKGMEHVSPESCHSETMEAELSKMPQNKREDAENQLPSKEKASQQVHVTSGFEGFSSSISGEKDTYPVSKKECSKNLAFLEKNSGFHSQVDKNTEGCTTAELFGPCLADENNTHVKKSKSETCASGEISESTESDINGKSQGTKKLSFFIEKLGGVSVEKESCTVTNKKGTSATLSPEDSNRKRSVETSSIAEKVHNTEPSSTKCQQLNTVSEDKEKVLTDRKKKNNGSPDVSAGNQDQNAGAVCEDTPNGNESQQEIENTRGKEIINKIPNLLGKTDLGATIVCMSNIPSAEGLAGKICEGNKPEPLNEKPHSTASSSQNEEISGASKLQTEEKVQPLKANSSVSLTEKGHSKCLEKFSMNEKQSTIETDSDKQQREHTKSSPYVKCLNSPVQKLSDSKKSTNDFNQNINKLVKSEPKLDDKPVISILGAVPFTSEKSIEERSKEQKDSHAKDTSTSEIPLEFGKYTEIDARNIAKNEAKISLVPRKINLSPLSDVSKPEHENVDSTEEGNGKLSHFLQLAEKTIDIKSMNVLKVDEVKSSSSLNATHEHIREKTDKSGSKSIRDSRIKDDEENMVLGMYPEDEMSSIIPGNKFQHLTSAKGYQYIKNPALHSDTKNENISSEQMNINSARDNTTKETESIAINFGCTVETETITDASASTSKFSGKLPDEPGTGAPEKTEKETCFGSARKAENEPLNILLENTVCKSNMIMKKKADAQCTEAYEDKAEMKLLSISVSQPQSKFIENFSQVQIKSVHSLAGAPENKTLTINKSEAARKTTDVDSNKPQNKPLGEISEITSDSASQNRTLTSDNTTRVCPENISEDADRNYSLYLSTSTIESLDDKIKTSKLHDFPKESVTLPIGADNRQTKSDIGASSKLKVDPVSSWSCETKSSCIATPKIEAELRDSLQDNFETKKIVINVEKGAAMLDNITSDSCEKIISSVPKDKVETKSEEIHHVKEADKSLQIPLKAEVSTGIVDDTCAKVERNQSSSVDKAREKSLNFYGDPIKRDFGSSDEHKTKLPCLPPQNKSQLDNGAANKIEPIVSQAISDDITKKSCSTRKSETSEKIERKFLSSVKVETAAELTTDSTTGKFSVHRDDSKDSVSKKETNEPKKQNREERAEDDFRLKDDVRNIIAESNLPVISISESSEEMVFPKSVVSETKDFPSVPEKSLLKTISESENKIIEKLIKHDNMTDKSLNTGKLEPVFENLSDSNNSSVVLERKPDIHAQKEGKLVTVPQEMMKKNIKDAVQEHSENLESIIRSTNDPNDISHTTKHKVTSDISEPIEDGNMTGRIVGSGVQGQKVENVGNQKATVPSKAIEESMKISQLYVETEKHHCSSFSEGNQKDFGANIKAIVTAQVDDPADTKIFEVPSNKSKSHHKAESAQVVTKVMPNAIDKNLEKGAHNVMPFHSDEGSMQKSAQNANDVELSTKSRPSQSTAVTSSLPVTSHRPPNVTVDKPLGLQGPSKESIKNVPSPKSPVIKPSIISSKVKNDCQNKGRRKSLESISMGIMMGKVAAKSSLQEPVNTGDGSILEEITKVPEESAPSDQVILAMPSTASCQESENVVKFDSNKAYLESNKLETLTCDVIVQDSDNKASSQNTEQGTKIAAPTKQLPQIEGIKLVQSVTTHEKKNSLPVVQKKDDLLVEADQVPDIIKKTEEVEEKEEPKPPIMHRKEIGAILEGQDVSAVLDDTTTHPIVDKTQDKDKQSTVFVSHEKLESEDCKNDESKIKSTENKPDDDISSHKEKHYEDLSSIKESISVASEKVENTDNVLPCEKPNTFQVSDVNQKLTLNKKEEEELSLFKETVVPGDKNVLSDADDPQQNNTLSLEISLGQEKPTTINTAIKLEETNSSKVDIQDTSQTESKDLQTAPEESSGEDVANDDSHYSPINDSLVEQLSDEMLAASPNSQKRGQTDEEIPSGKRSRVEESLEFEETGGVSSSEGEQGGELDGSSDEGESETGATGKRVGSITRACQRSGRGRRGRGRGSRGRSRAPRASADKSASPVPTGTLEDTKKEEEPITPVKPKANRGKRAPKLMGLDLGVDIVLEQSRGEEEGRPGGPPVRQSRRIAQMKIREEAERRKLEEMTLQQLKEEQSRRRADARADKKELKEGKKRKKKVIESDEDFTPEDVDEEASSKKKMKKKKKRRKKKPALSFNESNPWQSSSGSSTSQEEEEEGEQTEEEEEDDEELIFKSDHEFSPESDLENDATDVTPMRRARTAQKGLPCEDEEQQTDEHACQKCGKSDHPEWILLCDKCDSGWHGSCLRPALMVIPEGDWFCPPCEHTFLLENLHNNLLEFDRNWKRRENEELRRKRLAYVGISLDNVLPNKEGSGGESGTEMKKEPVAGSPSGSEVSGSGSGSSSDEDSEPVYQLRQRRQTLFSYRFNEYDDLINSAIQDEMEAVKGAGNQGRGKDIATIVKAEAEAEAQAQAQAQAEEMLSSQKVIETPEKSEEKVEEKEELVSEEMEKEELPPVVPKHDIKDEEEEEDDEFCPFKKFQIRKKHRRLNSLDISSEDDAESDEDFKGTSSEDDEDEYEGSEGESEDSEFTGRRGKGSRRRVSGPVRRSNRARITRFDKEFINDDSEDSEAPKKKSRKLWQDSDSEDSDASWRRSKRSKKQVTTFKTIKTKSKKKKKKRSKRDGDSDLEVYRAKKPKIKYGGLEEDEVSPTRRTRGRKINYQELAASDSEEETWGRARKLDSEDEYIANEDDDEEEEDEVLPDLEKESENESGELSEMKKVNKTKQDKKTKPKKAVKSSPDKISRKGKRMTKTNKAIIDSEEDIPPCTGVQVPSENEDPTCGLIGHQSVNTQTEAEMQSPPVVNLPVGNLPKERKGRTRGQGRKQEEQKKKGKRKKKNENSSLDFTEGLAPGFLKEKGNTGLLGKQLADIQLLPAQSRMGAEISVKSGETLMQRLTTAGRTVPITLGSNPDLLPEADRAMLLQSAKGAAETDPLRSLLAAPPVIPPDGDLKISEDVPPPAGKRKGRGRGKAAAAKAADVSHYPPLQNFPQSGSGIGNTSSSSVITRMLQSQPVSGTPQSFTAAATAMGHKYFGTTPGEPSLMSMQNAGRGTSSVPPYTGPPKGLSAPYRQPPPTDSSNSGLGPGMSHYGSSPSTRGSGIRGSPGFQQTGSMRLRNPPPSGQPHMFHTSHHPMDPSPSGGGPIIISSAAAPPPPPAGSPHSTKPGTPSTSQNTPTPPPPPPYSRPGSQLPLVPPTSTTMASMMQFSSQPGDSSQPPVRHPPPFPPSTSASHLQTSQGTPQSSSPTHQGRSPVPGNFSPYHPPPPANYHYGGYPPPPPMSAADDALPPSAFQGSPYTDHYTSSDMTANLQASDGSNSKSYDEEGGGEFGGLVSYFSSQREDDLDT